METRKKGAVMQVERKKISNAIDPVACGCAMLMQSMRDLAIVPDEPVVYETPDGCVNDPDSTMRRAANAHARYRRAMNARFGALLWLFGAWDGQISRRQAIAAVCNSSPHRAFSSLAVDRHQGPDGYLSEEVFLHWLLSVEEVGDLPRFCATVSMWDADSRVGADATSNLDD